MTDLGKARRSINDIDREIARLYELRMDAVSSIADYKKEHHLPIEDLRREEAVIHNNASLIANEAYRPYYVRFLRSLMDNSKDFQHSLINETLYVKSFNGNYPIHFGRNLLQIAGELLNLNRKTLIITDTGVPEQYVMTVASQCNEAIIFVFNEGETSKNMDTYSAIMQTLTENCFTRSDCIVAVGGGVAGDMAGFAAATYLRGIDFYNVPTTILSQVDSSVGGKTAINFGGYKNLVGAFYPPKGVLIDPEVLSTLPQRQISNGLAEAIKMALTHDTTLFELLENGASDESVLDEIIVRAIKIKISVVEADEYESEERKVLNFGHTLGHGIEAVTDLYHGECVAIGMIPMCSDSVRKRLVPTLERYGLPTTANWDTEKVLEACRHDKKSSGDTITIVTVPEIGRYELKRLSYCDYETLLREVLNG